MREFFHGWRWTAGCVTLVMACVFMGACLKQRVERRSTLADFQVRYPNHHLDEDGNTVFKIDGLSEDFVYPKLSWAPDLCVAVPLTLLSADLLLWKPRKRTGANHA